jgi:hypothetical protein
MTNKFYLSARSSLLKTIIIAGMTLTACAPLELSQPATSATEATVSLLAPTESVVSGYPGPEATESAHPSLPPNEAVITPSPNEKIGVGEIVEVPAPKDNFAYTYRIEQDTSPGGNALFRIFVQKDGKEIRLGDDSGTSHIQATSEQYIIWLFRAYESSSPIKSGLYVYEPESGSNTLVASGWEMASPEMAEDWVLYALWENAPSASQHMGGVTPDGVMSLLAYHIDSGKTIALSTSLPDIMGRGPGSFYSVSNGRAAWVEYSMETKTYAIRLSDLANGAVQELPVTSRQPLFLSLSKDMIVWRDTYWLGYSLAYDAFFTIPYAPQGWENVAGLVVTAQDGALMWSTNNMPDGQMHYFTAPIFIRESVTPQPFFEPPTPRPPVLPTSAPLPTLAPLAQPTSYP